MWFKWVTKVPLTYKIPTKVHTTILTNNTCENTARPLKNTVILHNVLSHLDYIVPQFALAVLKIGLIIYSVYRHLSHKIFTVNLFIVVNITGLNIQLCTYQHGSCYILTWISKTFQALFKHFSNTKIGFSMSYVPFNFF